MSVRLPPSAYFFSYGDGANGKSTFWNTLARVLGNYSGMMSADALTVDCKRNVKPEMAELKKDRPEGRRRRRWYAITFGCRSGCGWWAYLESP